MFDREMREKIAKVFGRKIAILTIKCNFLQCTVDPMYYELVFQIKAVQLIMNYQFGQYHENYLHINNFLKSTLFGQNHCYEMQITNE